MQTIGTGGQGTHTSLRLRQVPVASLWPSFQSQWPEQVAQSLVPQPLCVLLCQDLDPIPS